MRVREFRLITFGYDAGGFGSPASEVLRTMHCAPALPWGELCYLVTVWAHARGCEVERIDESRPFNNRVLRVFPPDESSPVMEWVEPHPLRAVVL